MGRPLSRSLSRALSRGITGGVSPFSPSDLPGLKLWLKADALSLNNNDPVATWTDSSGNNNAVQATAGAKPLFKTSILNGKPVIRFDGVDDNLLAALSSNLNTSTLTAYMVAVRRGVNAHTSAMVFAETGNDESGNAALFSYEGAASDRLSAYRGGFLSFKTPHPGNNVPYLFATKFDGTNNTSYFNGTGQTPVANSGAFNFPWVYLGSRFFGGTPSFFFNGDIAEVLLFNTAHSDSNRNAIESYLNSRWAIY